MSNKTNTPATASAETTTTLVELQPNQAVVTYKNSEAVRAQKRLASMLSRERSKFIAANPGVELPENLQLRTGGGSQSNLDTTGMSDEDIAKLVAFRKSKTEASKRCILRKKFIAANPGLELPEDLRPIVRTKAVAAVATEPAAEAVQAEVTETPASAASTGRKAKRGVKQA